MEKVYAFNMQVNNESVEYDVFFSNGEYHFVPENIQSTAPSLIFKLENSHWIALQKTDAAVEKQAVECLDKYLLSQH